MSYNKNINKVVMDYSQLTSQKSLQKTKDSLSKKGYEVTVKDKSGALAQIKKIIPDGASVMNGSSVTLEQIGYTDYLASGKHKWLDLHAQVTSIKNKRKRDNLRRQSVLSEYYLGSVHALTKTGEFVIATNSGSQLPHIVYTSPNLIFVVSTKKIVSNLDEAMKRLMEHVVPLEEKHMQKLYGVSTAVNKVLIFKGEKQGSPRKIYFILIEEDLGF